jgi:peptidoglycan/LPS O-acetylase OafA/YrhL
MPTVVHVERRGWVYSPYTCERCGHQDQGAVFMKASAGAQTGLLQDLDDTRDLAHGTAHGAMEQGGDALIALAPCPACGQRDELAVKNHHRKATPWLAGGGVFSLLGVAGLAYMISKDEAEMGAFVMAPILLLGAVALLVGTVKRLRRLPGGVVFRSLDSRPWEVI